MAPDYKTFDERVAAHYEAWYETPEGHRADELEKASLEWLLQRFSQPATLLEIGCGTGHFSRWLHSQGLTVVGLDFSLPMLMQAQVLDGVALVQADAGRLPFGGGAFDVTAFITTLEFLERPGKALEEALRVTRQGMILGVLNRWSLLGTRRRLAGLFHRSVYDTAHFYSVRKLKTLLRSIAGESTRIVWRTILFPRGLPWSQVPLPWGGFIAMALILRA